MPSKRQIKWRKAAAANPRGFVESRLRIPDLMGQEVPMLYNWAQCKASDFIKALHKTGEPVRAEIGKWRRAGITSSRSAEGYAHTYGTDNARVGVIAHLEDRAKEILANYKMFDQVLERRHPDLVLKKSKDNIFGIKFEDTNAQVLIATAKNPIKVRGDGIHWLEGSEFAHWFAQFDVVMKEVCPVVPPLPGSQIILESTGSLMGSHPHAHWLECGFMLPDGTIKRGQNEFIKLFLCWLEDPTLRIPFKSDKDRDELFELINFHEPRLTELNAHFKLTPEQIAVSWQMYHYQSKNDFDYFCREFPYDVNMMWAASGASFFGTYELTKAVPEHPQLIVVFDDRELDRLFRDPSELTRVETVEDYGPRPYVKFWRPPVRGERYVLGSDGSQGVPGGDYSAGYLRNARTRELMASYHGRLRPDEAGHINVSLARMYNNALLAPECNPQGGGTECLNVIQRLGYHHIYQYKRRDHIEGQVHTNFLGWLTQYRTKALMCGTTRQIFIDCMRGRMEDPGIFRDISLLREMRTFVLDPITGELGGSSGCWDDRVVADSICHQVISDQMYCTKDDPLVKQRRALDAKPIDGNRLIQMQRTPDQVIQSFMSPSSNFNRNKFEI